MRSRNRTPQPPLFRAESRPIGATWTWVATLQITSAGYVSGIHVEARRGSGPDALVGTASGVISIYDDVNDAIGAVAVEAMLVSVQQTLDGSTPHRVVNVSTAL